MPASNAEIVKGLLDRFAGGDLDAPLEHTAEEIEFGARHFPDGRVYRGHAGVRAFLRSFFDAVTDCRLEIHGIVESGEEVVVFARETGRGRGSGAAFEAACAQIYTLREGKVTRWRVSTAAG